ncbi:hypothetical protein [Pseudomonas sp. NPDC086278]|uniref:hypothetical protein n=1 Tax=Pseudomonas sp. NPDC086278 TaxID=3390646 RepID=UPI003CFCA7F7
MIKHYFVRKVALTLNGDRQIHLLALSSGISFKAKLDQALISKPVFPGMTYQATIVKRGRGLKIASLESAGDADFLDCKALASFVGTLNTLPRHTPSPSLGRLLEEAALHERCAVRQLLDQDRNQHNRYVLGVFLGEAHAAHLQFAWEDYMDFQRSVISIMAQGFDQTTAERMVNCLPENAAPHLLSNPLLALPFLEKADGAFAGHPGFEAVPALKPAMALLRYLEEHSFTGNTLVDVSDVMVEVAAGVGGGGGGEIDPVEGGYGVEVSGGSAGITEAIQFCEAHGWIVSNGCSLQLASNHRLQGAVRDHLTRICEPFHTTYSQREIDHAFNRLSAFTPDMFTYDMVDEVALAINSRVVIVRYDNIKAAIEFTQQYCAVYELLTNVVPTTVTVARARCLDYSDQLGHEHIPFFEIIDGVHEQAVLFQQFNQMPLFEMLQLLSNLGQVMNLIALVDTTLPSNAAVDQMTRYFPTIDIQVRQQGYLPIQKCFRALGEIEARIEVEDLQRIAVICDCPYLSQQLNRRYCSLPSDTKVPRKGDLIRLSPRGFRQEDDALVRIVNVKASDLLVSQAQTYRTMKAEEFSRHSWDAGFVLSPREAIGVSLPPVLVFTSENSNSGESTKGSALVRNLQAQGVRVIEHCVYEIERSPKLCSPGTLQRIVPLVE